MKPFSFFIFLNVLTLFAYAQNQNTCEQKFNLQGKSCSPCQQALSKVTGTPFTDPKQTPPDKCNVSFMFYHYLSEITSITPDNPIPEYTKVIEALDKTCAETANNACSESTAKSVYTDIDKICDAELNQYFSVKGTGKEHTPPNDVGFLAESTIATYYLAIPLRTNMCVKVGGEYCFAKPFDRTNKNQSEGVNPFNVSQCDECSKQTYSNIKSFQSSHPLDTPNLQKIMANSDTNRIIQEFESKCPDIANSLKSDGQKLSNQFYNYPGIILIGLLGYIYVTFM